MEVNPLPAYADLAREKGLYRRQSYGARRLLFFNVGPLCTIGKPLALPCSCQRPELRSSFARHAENYLRSPAPFEASLESS